MDELVQEIASPTQSPQAAEWKRLVVVIVVGYLALTGFSASIGALDGLGKRIDGFDAVFYYSYVTSVVVDHDLSLRNDLDKLFHKPYRREDTATGMAWNPFAVGAPLLWLPCVAVARVLTPLLAAAGVPTGELAFGPQYRAAVYIGDSLYGLLGLLLLARLLSALFDTRVATYACLTVLFASPLTHYLWATHPMSHCTSLFATAAFLWCYFRRGLGVWSGLLAGLMVITRWQDLWFLLLPAVITLDALRREGQVARHVRDGLRFAAGFLIALGPQLYAFHVLFGRMLLVPQGDDFISLGSLKLWELWFGAVHGFFLWHPLLALGVLGLLRRDCPAALWRASLLLTFVMQSVLNAAVTDVHAGWSFGQRRFISSLVIIALGVCALLWKRPELARRYYLPALVAFGLWNAAFVYQYDHGLIPFDEPLSVSEFVTDKFRLAQVDRGHALARRSITALLHRDTANYRKLAAQAYAESPTTWSCYTMFAISSLETGDTRGPEAFSRWLERQSDSPLARLGAAEWALRAGDVALATAQFPPEKPSRDPEVDRFARDALARGARSLLDPSVLTRLVKDHIWIDIFLR